ncbi:hypothetical protein AGABI1DRAFT_95378 [Agaricus bisporus var. burnettii JB137-S8]|uniref:Uncharacterized protein n=1 Tax=Agaricus bisporus var. burnettii (strain JB137-S8 / ATCC MYA-4627 / FGSC 10392) TaxID=597362 RepID=K5WHS5_AGABU|nr:uncharacterized protein AGABI1DRAFT_95378 [Agaricus bisporus var. burnettii JB137-S8]EKM74826.1 hypothetical protein AGABI1DRAFT_95378 [Agaricus bisporus var. burnettii JB137-S8]
MVCSLFVRQINHYDLDGITTIRGLILFLQDNPQAFSFEPPELPRHADDSWPVYRKELELARDEENKRRKKKRLPPLTGPIFLHESIEFVRHWNVWEMDEGWGDIFRTIERGTKPVSQAVLKRALVLEYSCSNISFDMPRKSNKQSAPAPVPHPYRPPSQAPPPPANPTAARLTVSDVETLLKPEYAITGLMNLANWHLDSQENRAIMDAVRNRGIAPAVAIANAEASALAKGNVKGPSGHSTGIGAAPPAVKTPPRVPTPPPRVPTPLPPVPTRPPSPPRAPSPSASVLSSKHPISPGSSSSRPSVAAVSVCDSEDSSMALDYEDVTTPRPASPADEEHLDSNESAEAVITLMNSAVDIFKALFEPDWKKGLIEAFPAIMGDDIERVRSVFTKKISRLRSILSPAVVAPASAVDAPAPRVIPRDAPPQADSAKSKPPKKKVRVDPAPSDVTPPATAPLMEVDEPAVPSLASGKAPTKPFSIPSSKRASTPKDAPPVSFRTPSAPRKRRQGKHTAHGVSRRGIILTLPAGSSVTAESFSPGVLNGLNQVLRSDVKSNVTLTHATVEGNGIFLAASRVPTAAEIQFVLKHVRRTFPNKSTPIVHSPATSTSYLKIVDIPHVPASPKEWATKQHEAFMYALDKSPVGASLAKLFKHKPRFMRASPHSDSCWAWIDIHDTVAGSNARDYISKFISAPNPIPALFAALAASDGVTILISVVPSDLRAEIENIPVVHASLKNVVTWISSLFSLLLYALDISTQHISNRLKALSAAPPSATGAPSSIARNNWIAKEARTQHAMPALPAAPPSFYYSSTPSLPPHPPPMQYAAMAADSVELHRRAVQSQRDKRKRRATMAPIT